MYTLARLHDGSVTVLHSQRYCPIKAFTDVMAAKELARQVHARLSDSGKWHVLKVGTTIKEHRS
ncbi:hypothetical protein [Shouchella clausii]|uniref:Uncharacterized protein n=1 Tax=Shouchella clausii TaxID=79880 RepID=A0A268RW38_SHOCL|nr:hypothetical protein [Shouchella clausii]PAD41814.1 hypothetical protein CHH54_15510 [Bacillus sp. 7520-S]MBU8598181.1 hypothetical protein [Shouchella clausii]MCY1106895.1 hypothetical protein [Shouchella clausii]MEB5479529.1 hypothetical protein [Shouchella clausii]MED4158058.1 hypothetical protein [Shouchella clausii]